MRRQFRRPNFEPDTASQPGGITISTGAGKLGTVCSQSTVLKWPPVCHDCVLALSLAMRRFFSLPVLFFFVAALRRVMPLLLAALVDEAGTPFRRSGDLGPGFSGLPSAGVQTTGQPTTLVLPRKPD